MELWKHLNGTIRAIYIYHLADLTKKIADKRNNMLITKEKLCKKHYIENDRKSDTSPASSQGYSSLRIGSRPTNRP